MLPRGRRLVFSVFLAISVSLFLTSCGGGSDNEAAVPKAEPSGETGEFAVYTVRSAGFSIALPRSWESISSDDVDPEAIDKYADENPSMRPLLEGLYEPGSPIKLLALVPPPSGEFATNLNVVVRDAAPGQTVEEFGSPASLEELKRQAAELLRGPVESDLVDLPAGTAHKLSLQLELEGLQGQVFSVYQEQYEFISGGEYYALVYSTDSDRKSEYESVFAESARSFKLG